MFAANLILLAALTLPVSGLLAFLCVLNWRGERRRLRLPVAAYLDHLTTEARLESSQSR